MKRWNLLLSAATACLLLGASNAAMAQRDCPIITNETVDDLTIDGPCLIVDSVIRGNIEVRGSSSFSLIDSRVQGRVRVRDSNNVLLKDNDINDNPVIVNDSDIVWIVNNRVNGGAGNSFMRFNNNRDEVQIYNNNVAGDLRCNNQTANVVTSGNFVRGRDTCRLR